MATGTVSSGPGPIQVNVLKQNIGGQDRAFVVQPKVSIGTGATQAPAVRWINSTGAPAKLWFPNGDQLFVTPPGGFSNPIDIPAGGLTLEVKNRPNFGDYHYHVYSEAVGDCALGDSEPRLSCP
jgi:hypothetical protein